MRARPQARRRPSPGTRSDLPRAVGLGTMEHMSVSEEPLLEEPQAGELHVDQLEDADRELLNAVQWDFRLEPRPYAVLGERLDSEEAEVRARVARVKELGVLRQLSAIFDTRALGYGSSLVAAQIDLDRVDAAAAVISAHPGVSHNYKRNHAYNLWYTIAVPPGESLEEHIDVLHRDSGAIVTRKLPTLKLYKIGGKLDMTGARPTTTGRTRSSRWCTARTPRSARRRSRRSTTRPASTSTRCCGRSRSTRRPACATTPTTGTTGAPRTSLRPLDRRHQGPGR